MEQLYQQIRSKIQAADAVLIGASNGLSISEGYNIFADDAWFQKYFGDFRKKYGIRSLLQGMFLDFEGPQERWAYFSRLAYLKRYQEQPSQMMKNLYALVEDKDYFVVTSNGEDHFSLAGFDPERVFEMEGKITEYRCANHCHETVYNRPEDIIRMAKAETDGRVPTEAIPKCPRCGGFMEPNLAADQSFFQTEHWKKKAQKYQNFIQKRHGSRLVILEFGVGWRNQMIKAPLMRLAASEPEAFYITFNKGELFIPKEIAEKSIGVDGDLASALNGILQTGGKQWKNKENL